MIFEYFPQAVQNFFPAILCGIFFIFFLIFNKHFNRDINLYFYLIIGTTICLAISDMFQGYYETLSTPTTQRMIAACFSYSLRPAILFSFTLLYLRNFKKRYKLILGIPILVNTIIVFMAFVTPLVFSYTDKNELIRGPLISVPFIVSIIYFIVILLYGIKNIKSNGCQEFLFLLAIFIITVGATLLEMMLRYQGFIVVIAIFGTMFYYMYFMSNNYSTDSLTRAYIRNKFYYKVEQYSGNYTIICYDVNDLKLINDTEGHNEGDKALKTVARVILETIPTNGSLYRFGGDEFIIFLPTEEDKIIDDIISKIKLKLFFTSYSISIGHAKHSECSSLNDLLDKADTLMYQDKKDYKFKKFGLKDSSIETNSKKDGELEKQIIFAIENKKYIPFFQGQYSHSTGNLIGAEALARLPDGNNKFISPAVFIPILEKRKLISKLDLLIFEGVCKFVKNCIDNNLDVVPISTNISRFDVLYPHFVNELEDIRRYYGIDAKYLPLEITETGAISGKEGMIAVIKQLHKLGYRIEIDDFGSGYSSLNILKDIEFDILKLDMGFMSDCATNSKGGTIISTIIHMANSLGIQVIAEGVSSITQADFLRMVGCDYIQGYLYSRPMSGEDFYATIKDGTTKKTISHINLIDHTDDGAFWSPDSRDNLIFNNFVGPSILVEYKNKFADIIKFNFKFITLLDNSIQENELINKNLFDLLSEESSKALYKLLDNLKDDEEKECPISFDIVNKNKHTQIDVRIIVKLISKANNYFTYFITFIK